METSQIWRKTPVTSSFSLQSLQETATSLSLFSWYLYVGALTMTVCDSVMPVLKWTEWACPDHYLPQCVGLAHFVWGTGNNTHRAYVPLCYINAIFVCQFCQFHVFTNYYSQGCSDTHSGSDILQSFWCCSEVCTYVTTGTSFLRTTPKARTWHSLGSLILGFWDPSKGFLRSIYYC